MSAYCPYTSTHKWSGVSYKMKKFVFLTRVTRIENVQQIKDMLARIFNKTLISENLKNIMDTSGEITYQHILLPDLTVANKKEDFEKFKDEHTRLFFIEQKRKDDKYAAYNLDEAIQTIPADEDCWIYILDDDNKINQNFASLARVTDLEGRIIVFNIKMPMISNGFDGTVTWPLESKKALFHIDSANYLVHRSVYEIIGQGNEVKSDWHDGIFIEKALCCHIPMIYVNEVLGYHNGL